MLDGAQDATWGVADALGRGLEVGQLGMTRLELAELPVELVIGAIADLGIVQDVVAIVVGTELGDELSMTFAGSVCDGHRKGAA